MVSVLSNRALSSRLREQQRPFSSRLTIFNFPSSIKIEKRQQVFSSKTSAGKPFDVTSILSCHRDRNSVQFSWASVCTFTDSYAVVTPSFGYRRSTVALLSLQKLLHDILFSSEKSSFPASLKSYSLLARYYSLLSSLSGRHWIHTLQWGLFHPHSSVGGDTEEPLCGGARLTQLPTLQCLNTKSGGLPWEPWNTFQKEWRMTMCLFTQISSDQTRLRHKSHIHKRLKDLASPFSV